MKGNIEIKPRDDGRGWQFIQDGVDLAGGISNTTIVLDGGGGMLSVNGIPKAVLGMKQVGLFFRGEAVGMDLDDDTKHILRLLGWEKRPDSPRPQLDE